jgi:diguanylate cyclase (GGDEF)-like protein
MSKSLHPLAWMPPLPEGDEDIWSAQALAWHWRARQLQWLLQSNRAAPPASMTFVVLVLLISDGQLPWEQVLAWCLPLLVMSVLYLWDSHQHRRRPLQALGDAGLRQRFVLHGAAQAVGFGLIYWGLYDRLDQNGQFLLGLMSAAAIPIGAMTVATVTEMALVWVILFAAFAFACTARLGTPLYLMIAGATVLMAVVTAISVVSIGRGLKARLMAETEARQAQQALGVMLRDIESQSSDWVWVADETMGLAHAAEPLAHCLAATEGAPVLGQPLLRLLAARLASDTQQAARLQAIEQAVQAGTPFRNIELKLQPGPNEAAARVLSFSGVPIRAGRATSSGWRGVVRDVTVLRSQAEELFRLAHTDSLTGLANRHILMRTCTECLRAPWGADAPASRIPLSFYLLDLDDFKSVNDTFGHVIGDLLLQEVAQRLTRLVDGHPLTQGAVLARLGGDEFALILTRGHSAIDRDLLGHLLCETLKPTWITEALRVDIRVSIGVSSWVEAGTRADTLLREADVALYEAKASGRNKVLTYSKAMGERVARRTEMSKELSQLLGNGGYSGFGPDQAGQLMVHYQPQVELQHQRIIGVEALMRWKHPRHGMVSPVEFIPVAEETGMILALGRWVLEQACRDARQWSDAIRVAVNVSGHQIADGRLVATIQSVLAASGLPARRLELEITETALMADPALARSTLIDLHRIGVTLALDDFGTGYSSLAYLATLPVDLVKIDRSFVCTMLTDRLVETVVTSILQLCSKMGVSTLAEGIESPEQIELLLRHGCAYGQGYLFAQAMPAAAVRSFQAPRGSSVH